MKLIPADVIAIRDMSVNQFADWLQSGFEDIVSGNRDRLARAFEPLHLIIIRSQTVVDDLECVYEALDDARVQATFRKGLSGAFDRLAIQGHQSEALTSILALAQRISAHELITHIVPMLLNTGSCSESPSIFKHAFDYLATMAPLSAAKNAVVALVTSERFDPTFSIYAFITLCRCDPASWLDHLNTLRSHIASARVGKKSPNALLTAKRFVSLVPLSNIAQQILRLETSRNRVRAMQGDNWLGEALLVGPQSPLVVHEDNDGRFTLGRRGDDRQLVPISDAREANPETIRLLNRVKEKHLRNVQVTIDRLSSIRTLSETRPGQTVAIELMKRWARFVESNSHVHT